MGRTSRWVQCLWLAIFMAGTFITVAGESESSLLETGKASALLNQTRLLDADSNTNNTNTSPTSEVVAPATNGTEGGSGSGNNDDTGGTSSAGAGGDGGNSQTDPPSNPAQPPDPTPSAGVCSDAKTCQDCVEASEKLDDKDTHLCVWELGTGDDSICQKKSKDDPGNPTGDLCSGSETIPEIVASDDDSNGTVKILGIIAVLVGCGFYIKSKMSGGVASTMSSGSPAGKVTKYHEVAVDDEDGDEEWGWGDDSGADNGGLEMAGRDGTEDIPAYKDDKNVKRRTSGDSSPFTVPSPNSSPSQSTSRTHNKTMVTSLAPKLPPAPKSLPIPTSFSASKPSTSSGSHTSIPMAMPDPIPQHITSLGKKTPTKPKPAPKKQEDDIFASMGLAAKPKFSHIPAGGIAGASHRTTTPMTSSAPATTGSSRWGQPSSTTAFGGASMGTSAIAAHNLGTSESIDDGDDNWDDDPLDDLLDD